MNTTKRQAYYYQISSSDGDSDLFATKLKKIHTLTSQQREYEHLEGVTLSVVIAEKENVIQGFVQILRSNAVPSIRMRGTEDSHPIELSDGEGVNEKTHFIYNPTTHNLIMEYNHHGPRIGLFARAVDKLYKTHFDTEKPPRTTYAYIQSGNGLRKVTESFGIKVVDAHYTNPSLSGIDEDANIAHAFKAARNMGGEPYRVGIILKPRKFSKDIIMKPTAFINNFINPDTSLEEYEKLQVKIQRSETGGVEVIDLLQDKLVSVMSYVKLRDGTSEIDSDNMFENLNSDLESWESRQ